jgi:hypothetical protein
VIRCCAVRVRRIILRSRADTLSDSARLLPGLGYSYGPFLVPIRKGHGQVQGIPSAYCPQFDGLDIAILLYGERSAR